MIKSMTGFGKAECLCQNQRLSIEIKSLNSKYFDLNLRVPNGFREKEPEIRTMLTSRLLRGKIDFTINIEEAGEMGNYSINQALAKKYFEELKRLSKEIENKEFADYLPVIMRLPDVMVTAKKEIDQEEWSKVSTAIVVALDKIEEYRIGEGKTLEADLGKRNAHILELLEKIKPYEKQRIEILKTRIRKDLSEVIEREEIDENRFEQELIYYLEKLDITEEKVRLREHCNYFLETMKEKESHGKKLGFIAQEMGREINTLGAKANDSSIQKLVVQMKDELEKIKEQLFNIV